MSTMSTRTLCLEHGEKVLFGASVLVLAGYILFGWVLRSEDPTVAAAREDLRKAQARLACDDSPILERFEDPAVARGWAVEDAGPTFSWWIPYLKPRIVPRPVPGGVVQPGLVLKPPVLQPPTTEVGRVDLEWAPEEGSSAPLKGWLVFRRAAGGEWGEVASLPTDARTWSDEKLDADAPYEYRIEAVPDALAVFEEQGRSSSVRAVRTPDGTRMRLLLGSPGLAMIQVEKFLAGEWRSQKFSVRPGEAIGQDLRNPIGGTLLPMSTGCVLIAIEEATRVRKETRKGDHLVPDPSNPSRQLLMPYEYEVEVPDRLTRATYRDRGGEVRELWQETGRP
ncbi:MAG: fibronectin type III domain-containing protein [Planctomycetota bacterium]